MRAPRLAWKVLSGGRQADGTPSRLASYVDAKSGALLRSEQEIVNVDGTGGTLYSGTVPLQITQSGSTYQLKDPTRGGTYTTDMNNSEDSYRVPDLRLGLQDRDPVHEQHHDVRQRQHQQQGLGRG